MITDSITVYNMEVEARHSFYSAEQCIISQGGFSGWNPPPPPRIYKPYKYHWFKEKWKFLYN